MSPMISIVTTASEYQACVAVRAAAFISRGEPYSEEFDGNDFVCATHLLATIDKEPVGTLRIRLLSADDGGVAVWERLAVAPAARRGPAIINSLANHARAYTLFKGCQTVIGAVADPRLLAFWKKRGFVETGNPPVVYNNVSYKQVQLRLVPMSASVDLHDASQAEANRFAETALEQVKPLPK